MLQGEKITLKEVKTGQIFKVYDNYYQLLDRDSSSLQALHDERVRRIYGNPDDWMYASNILTGEIIKITNKEIEVELIGRFNELLLE